MKDEKETVLQKSLNLIGIYLCIKKQRCKKSHMKTYWIDEQFIMLFHRLYNTYRR